jgi:AraC family transcriptional regulator of adaptative response/methylated-DNA-[protein]-cysteine methyltransferase
VHFFATPDEAMRAGFRACKRCKPTSIDESTLLANEVCRVIEAAGEDAVTLDTLARRTGATPTRIQRAFKRATGLSPKEYQDAHRGERLRKHLRDGQNVTRATIDAGYRSTSRVHDQAGRVLGMSPRAFRNRGKGMHIEFGTTATPLGTMLVAFTERGICAASLGNDSDALEAELRAQFSAAEIAPANAAGQQRIASVVAAMKPGGRMPPVDLSGTAFQLLVWRALQRIPIGETRSYGALASSIGRPTAARAVARACAQNRLAVIVPCHRVIRGDGDLGGYRWGIDRKKRLLDRESSSSKP